MANPDLNALRERARSEPVVEGSSRPLRQRLTVALAPTFGQLTRSAIERIVIPVLGEMAKDIKSQREGVTIPDPLQRPRTVRALIQRERIYAEQTDWQQAAVRGLEHAGRMVYALVVPEEQPDSKQ